MSTENVAQEGPDGVLGTSLVGKVAIVAGGGSGIGYATARMLAELGATTVVLDLRMPGFEDVSGTPRLEGDVVDISDARAVDAVVARITERYGQIDVLVNSAGILRWGGTIDTSEEDWERVLAVNLKGTWLMCRSVAAVMKEHQSGSIVNVASNMAVKGVANQVAYSASKGGVVALTKSMAVDLGPSGIRVNCVNPGHIRTPMGDSASQRLGLTAEGIRSKYPLGRVGDVDEVARMIVFLAADLDGFTTGAVVAVDGGNTA